MGEVDYDAAIALLEQATVLQLEAREMIRPESEAHKQERDHPVRLAFMACEASGNRMAVNLLRKAGAHE